MDPVSAWDNLSYIDGILFSLWLGLLYWSKGWIDNYWRNK